MGKKSSNKSDETFHTSVRIENIPIANRPVTRNGGKRKVSDGKIVKKNIKKSPKAAKQSKNVKTVENQFFYEMMTLHDDFARLLFFDDELDESVMNESIYNDTGYPTGGRVSRGIQPGRNDSFPTIDGKILPKDRPILRTLHEVDDFTTIKRTFISRGIQVDTTSDKECWSRQKSTVDRLNPSRINYVFDMGVLYPDIILQASEGFEYVPPDMGVAYVKPGVFTEIFYQHEDEDEDESLFLEDDELLVEVEAMKDTTENTISGNKVTNLQTENIISGNKVTNLQTENDPLRQDEPTEKATSLEEHVETVRTGLNNNMELDEDDIIKAHLGVELCTVADDNVDLAEDSETDNEDAEEGCPQHEVITLDDDSLDNEISRSESQHNEESLKSSDTGSRMPDASVSLEQPKEVLEEVQPGNSQTLSGSSNLIDKGVGTSPKSELVIEISSDEEEDSTREDTLSKKRKDEGTDYEGWESEYIEEVPLYSDPDVIILD